MKKFPIIILMVSFLMAVLTSCADGDVEEDFSINSKMLTATIESSELIGVWDLSAMNADTAVDIDGDGVANTNLLLETSCFDPMGITFNEDMTFTSVNSRMDFKAGDANDEFLCLGNNIDSGTWSVDGDVLTLHVIYDSSIYTHEKTLSLNGNTFSFEVSKTESMLYVDDPGDTSVSGVLILSLEYKQ